MKEGCSNTALFRLVEAGRRSAMRCGKLSEPEEGGGGRGGTAPVPKEEQGTVADLDEEERARFGWPPPR